MTHASDGPALDPRVPAQVAALTDDQVGRVLMLMHDEWTGLGPALDLVERPEANRDLLVETVRLNMGNGGEAEYTLFLEFIARVTAASA
ncbi:MAG: hypothetical protein HGA45_34935 [Chloroflexales bacterium]|nr:hypothetical protein [Chloroflexales bacterium]